MWGRKGKKIKELSWIVCPWAARRVELLFRWVGESGKRSRSLGLDISVWDGFLIFKDRGSGSRLNETSALCSVPHCMQKSLSEWSSHRRGPGANGSAHIGEDHSWKHHQSSRTFAISSSPLSPATGWDTALFCVIRYATFSLYQCCEYQNNFFPEFYKGFLGVFCLFVCLLFFNM